MANDKVLRNRQSGLSLVETAAVISLCGVLGAAFLPTFYKQLRFSKVAEASQRLDQLYRSTAAYYSTERQLGGKLARGCLPGNAGPTPAQPSAEAVSVDFSATDVIGRETWEALAFEPGTLRYSYQVVIAEPGCAPRVAPAYPAVTFRATGDLDGDGVHSLLERSASISSEQSALLPIVPLRIIDRVE